VNEARVTIGKSLVVADGRRRYSDTATQHVQEEIRRIVVLLANVVCENVTTITMLVFAAYYLLARIQTALQYKNEKLTQKLTIKSQEKAKP